MEAIKVIKLLVQWQIQEIAGVSVIQKVEMPPIIRFNIFLKNLTKIKLELAKSVFLDPPLCQD